MQTRVLGLREAKDMVETLEAEFFRATGVRLFGEWNYSTTESNLYAGQPTFSEGKISLIKSLRAFSKEAVAFHDLREAKAAHIVAERRIQETYKDYLNAVDAAVVTGERLAALTNALESQE